MMETATSLMAALTTAGWSVSSLETRRTLPPLVIQRYPWLPVELVEFIERAALVRNEDETAWLLASPEFHGGTESAYAWNEWELQSLAAAEGDLEWQRQIRDFWVRHCPLLLSVKSGYSYFAIQRETLAVVYGEEPEYESVSVIAPSWAEFMNMVASREQRLKTWL